MLDQDILKALIVTFGYIESEIDDAISEGEDQLADTMFMNMLRPDQQSALKKAHARVVGMKGILQAAQEKTAALVTPEP